MQFLDVFLSTFSKSVREGGEVKMQRWQIISLILAMALIASLGFSVYQSYNASNSSGGVFPPGAMRFTFLWGPDAQPFVNGTFRIDVVVWFEDFVWDNETTEIFDVLVKVYDDDYWEGAYLGLTLDMNRNGKIDFSYDDQPVILFADNTTYLHCWLDPDGIITWPEMPKDELDGCIYNPGEGYTFGPFKYALADVMSKFWNFRSYIPMHICYGGGVSFQFWVYPDKETIPEASTYTVQLTSVNATVRSQPITIEGEINIPISFKLIRLWFRKDGKVFTGDVAMTVKDGKFKNVLPGTLFEPGTYELSAVLNNYTSNVLQFTLGE